LYKSIFNRYREKCENVFLINEEENVDKVFEKIVTLLEKL